jgi:hypothetical protein
MLRTSYMATHKKEHLDMMIDIMDKVVKDSTPVESFGL